MNARSGSPAATDVFVLDDENGFEIALTNVRVSEGAGPALFTVCLRITQVLQSQAQGTQVTVDYATANGIATAGSDYMAIATSALTFARGDETQAFYVIRTVSVPVADDPADETFTITPSTRRT